MYQLICVVGETRQGDDKDSNLYRIYLQRIEHLHYKMSNYDSKIVTQSMTVVGKI